jgi:hypothetical protein
MFIVTRDETARIRRPEYFYSRQQYLRSTPAEKERIEPDGVEACLMKKNLTPKKAQKIPGSIIKRIFRGKPERISKKTAEIESGVIKQPIKAYGLPNRIIILKRPDNAKSVFFF